MALVLATLAAAAALAGAVCFDTADVVGSLRVWNADLCFDRRSAPCDALCSAFDLAAESRLCVTTRDHAGVDAEKVCAPFDGFTVMKQNFCTHFALHPDAPPLSSTLAVLNLSRALLCLTPPRQCETPQCEPPPCGGGAPSYPC